MKELRFFSALAAFAAVNANAQSQQRPNLVLFMADDCTYFDLGCYGSKDSKTPNIDRLATQGIRFSKAYQAAPMCSPTRHNLYTGLWPVKTGAYPNHAIAKEGTMSIIHHLKPAGYKVALVGKSHVQPKSVFPWDHYSTLTESNDINFTAVDSFIKSCTSNHQPFCLFVMSNQPHTPWNKGNPALFDPAKIQLPPHYVDIPETRTNFCKYLAEINYMDQEFGKLLNKLEEHKVQDKTAVVFLSEQGNSLPFAKWTCYEAGVHSACLVRWPGMIQPNSNSDAIVEYVDIVPTFLGIAGLEPGRLLDGKSFLPVLRGKEKDHKQYTFSLQTTRGIYSGSEYYGIRSVADKRYRYVVNLTPDATFQNTEILAPLFKKWQQKGQTDSLARWITTRFQHRPAIELYDLEKDLHCIHDLAGLTEYQPVIERMDRALKAWMASCGDEGQATEMQALDHQFKNADGTVGGEK
jgi:uncharacterized sulfatase